MFLISFCSCRCPIQWSQVLSRDWRFNWSSADRCYSNYIWVINKFIAYKTATYIRGFTIPYYNGIAYCILRWNEARPLQWRHTSVSNHRPLYCSFNTLFRTITKAHQMSALQALCGATPAVSNIESVSMVWHLDCLPPETVPTDYLRGIPARSGYDLGVRWRWGRRRPCCRRACAGRLTCWCSGHRPLLRNEKVANM